MKPKRRRCIGFFKQTWKAWLSLYFWAAVSHYALEAGYEGIYTLILIVGGFISFLLIEPNLPAKKKQSEQNDYERCFHLIKDLPLPEHCIRKTVTRPKDF